MHKTSKHRLVHTDRIDNRHKVAMLLQTYFIKANSDSVSDWHFRVMTQAEERGIEFHVEVFRINKNNHGLAEAEWRRGVAKREKHASTSNIIVISVNFKSCPLNHNWVRNHIWKIHMHAYNSHLHIQGNVNYTNIYSVPTVATRHNGKQQVWNMAIIFFMAIFFNTLYSHNFK